MNTKKLTISSKNISQKQWTNLLIELNLVREAWKPYAKLELQAPGLKKILSFGRRTHDTKITNKNDKITIKMADEMDRKDDREERPKNVSQK